MPADIAAAYLGIFDSEGAPDAKRFARLVKKGLYPQPYRRPGERRAWLKIELDETLEGLRTTARHSAAEEELD